MEWESIEIPVSDQEKTILKLIQDGFDNLNIRYNSHQSMLSFMKIDYTTEIEMYIYEKYFQKEILDIFTQDDQQHKNSKKSKKDSSKNTKKKETPTVSPLFVNFHPELPKTSKFKPPKKIDLLRLNNMDTNIQNGGMNKSKIVEFILLEFCNKLIKGESNIDFAYSTYTLLAIQKATISYINKFVLDFVKQVIEYVKKQNLETLKKEIFHHAYEIMEKNPYLLRFEDMTLYDHQKQLFQLFRRGPIDEFGVGSPAPSCMLLYTAPTGTGKTMSPLGLSTSYKIIYICAARHIGLSLARSAISMNRRVAFAFGCETAADIRLHYYAAVEYTKNTKTGGIFKVDNSNGSKVDIMICNIRSYLVAMQYMLAFHKEENIILYWDEPTITLDVETHELHELIQRNWRENKISRIVLSCATLPEDDELRETFEDYRERFGGDIHRITSIDCKKTIRLLDSNGGIIVPHLLFRSMDQIRNSVMQFRKQATLLRYLDVREIVRFIEHVLPLLNGNDEHANLYLDNYFHKIEDFTMNRLKMYYLDVLETISDELYPSIHDYCKNSNDSGSYLQRIQSMDTVNLVKQVEGKPLHKIVSMASAPKENPYKGVLLTTEDAHTLTDGPTIYIVEDVQKMAKFYMEQSRIPTSVLDDILTKIDSNNVIQQKMEIMTKQLDDMLGKEIEKERKMENETFKPEAKRLKESIDGLRLQLQSAALSHRYIPNTRQHQSVWIHGGKLTETSKFVENAFIPMIDEQSILKIMELSVDNQMKLLLLLGIGVFDSIMTSSQNPAIASYMEVMKRLAYDQKLFLIIASSDYIYGTNYQLCHGFLGKDLENMTQQKIIQAMGRIGRNNIQQEYTIRFRDESIIERLFLPPKENIEAINMCKLLNNSGLHSIS